MGRAFVAAAVLGLAACNDAAEAPLAPESGAAAAAQVPAEHRLARLVAAGLRNPQVRAQLRSDMAESPVKEGKLYLRSYLGGSGQGLLVAMSRAAGTGQQGVLDLVNQAPALEIYMPVAEHRQAWNGGTDVLVAIQLAERTNPFGVDLNGREVALSYETAPATPVISIVPTESFDAQGEPLSRDRARPGASFTHSTTGAMFTGLWVNHINVGHDYEDWTRGSPEFEFWLINSQNRSTITCAEEDRSVEPYRFNMDGTSYSNDFLLAAEYEMPQGVPLSIAMYEDDDTRCEIRDDKDYIKLATDAFTNAYGAYKALTSKEWVNGQWIMQVGHAYMAFASIARSNDEFVGVATGSQSVDGTERVFTLANDQMMKTGTVYLQWKTDTAH
ncbi:MAG TPA: hypothetical protein VHG93_20025 [Longimicrobium sp.]|nr:hypothetical protein [Longimicrobium sp.]